MRPCRSSDFLSVVWTIGRSWTARAGPAQPRRALRAVSRCSSADTVLSLQISSSEDGEDSEWYWQSRSRPASPALIPSLPSTPDLVSPPPSSPPASDRSCPAAGGWGWGGHGGGQGARNAGELVELALEAGWGEELGLGWGWCKAWEESELGWME